MLNVAFFSLKLHLHFIKPRFPALEGVSAKNETPARSNGVQPPRNKHAAGNGLVGKMGMVATASNFSNQKYAGNMKYIL